LLRIYLEDTTMQRPVQITFRGIPHSDALEAYVRAHVTKLETFAARITGCRVAIESPHQHAHSGRHYRVCVDLTVPGEEIAITRSPDETISNEDAHSAVDRAFDEAGRRLQDYVRRQRGDVKPHEHHRHGRVKKLFTYEGYGFVETPEGEEVYFHRNAVLNGAFGRMKIGHDVTFVEEMGEKGPQASTIVLRD
jgi:cold shock CspA family protein